MRSTQRAQARITGELDGGKARESSKARTSTDLPTPAAKRRELSRNEEHQGRELSTTGCRHAGLDHTKATACYRRRSKRRPIVLRISNGVIIF